MTKEWYLDPQIANRLLKLHSNLHLSGFSAVNLCNYPCLGGGTHLVYSGIIPGSLGGSKWNTEIQTQVVHVQDK